MKSEPKEILGLLTVGISIVLKKSSRIVFSVKRIACVTEEVNHISELVANERKLLGGIMALAGSEILCVVFKFISLSCAST